MMTIEEGLVDYLKREASIAALIGDRIYPQVIPQQAKLPAIAYQLISDPIEYTHDGEDALSNPRIQFTCEASSYRDGKVCMNALETALSGYRGSMGAVDVQAVFCENKTDSYSVDSDHYVARMDAIIWHIEM